MQLGVVGLGRMGGAIALRLMRGGHACVVYDHDRAAVDRLVAEGATGAGDLADLKAKLQAPRAVWVMLPAGGPTEDTIAALGDVLERGDTVIDGGNGFYRDDIRRAEALSGRGLAYLDVGTSGGVWGLERGFCMMVGGEASAMARIEPILESLAPGPGAIPRTQRPQGSDSRAEEGYIHARPAGARPLVKKVHNRIQHGPMQAHPRRLHN